MRCALRSSETMNGDGNAAYKPRRGRTPCMDCTEHSMHCHSTCEKYKAYRAWRDARSKELRRQNAGLVAYAEFTKKYQLQLLKKHRK